MSAGLNIVPLGGLGEIGKNMMSVEYGRNILIGDVGSMFPEAAMPGVDYIIPDWEYLRDKKDLLRRIVITHGHQDHVGALPHFLQELDVPVHASMLTRSLIEGKVGPRVMREREALGGEWHKTDTRAGHLAHLCHPLLSRISVQ